MKRKNNCNLLPHIRENIYGFNRDAGQILGWEIKKFDIPKYWQHSQGENVIVAVIDTGCDINHNDLKNNIIQGYNFIGGGEPIDDNGHGSHVSGIIAAENNDCGVVGIAPKTKILPIKALDSKGSGNNKIVAKAIRYAVDHKCNFITMSLGSANESQDIHDAIIYANKKGSIIFCAAGNAGQETPIMFPARYNETISIGSIDRNLRRSSFSCSGYELDFLCPGQDIISCVPNNNYASMSGTSMSAPFAVGCASLLLSYAKSNGFESRLQSVEDYINIFKKSCKPLSDIKFSKNNKYQGNGILYPTIDFSG